MVHRIAFSAVVTGVLWLLPTAASSTTSGCQPGSEGATVVLLARSFIAQDTLGTVIVAKRMFVVAQIPCSQRATGAIGDPSFFKGRRAAHDIFPGVQLTRRDFSGVVKVSMTSSVRAGGLVALVVTVTPRARCTIRVVYDGIASKAKGLGAKSGARITWRWRVDASTPPGRWPVVVRCGASGSLRTAIRVLGR